MLFVFIKKSQKQYLTNTVYIL